MKSSFMPPVTALFMFRDCVVCLTLSVFFFVISVCDPVLGDHGSMVSLVAVSCSRVCAAVSNCSSTIDA